MKRVSFYKLSGLVMNVLLVAFVFTACKKQTSEVAATGSHEEIATAKGGSKPNTYPIVSLSMTVNDASGNKITSDGGGDYINGSENVKVVFDQYGNFMFNSRASNNPNVAMARWLNFNFDDPITASPPVTGTERSSFISTGKTTTSPAFTPLQNLDIDATQCIGLSAGLINFDLTTINFHRNLEDNATTTTAYVYVTRTDATHWIVTPVPPLSGGCSTISNVVAFITNNGAYRYYYNLPFSFTLTVI